MTTLTTSLPTAPHGLTPTTLDRVLLGLSRMLADTAQTRMRARAIRRAQDATRAHAREGGRSALAEAEFWLRVR